METRTFEASKGFDGEEGRILRGFLSWLSISWAWEPRLALLQAF